MRVMRPLPVRLISTAVVALFTLATLCTLAALTATTAAAQIVDTNAVAATAAPIAAPASDSAAVADSARLIARLLTANGASRERAARAGEAIMKYARRHGLDPLLVVGVIGVENAALKPRARSRVGAQGVMQVMPSWKRDIRDCGEDLRRIDVNVCFGTRILRIALDQSQSMREALLRYNGCVRSPGCHKYANNVFSWAGRAMLLSRAEAAPAPAPATTDAAAAALRARREVTTASEGM